MGVRNLKGEEYNLKLKGRRYHLILFDEFIVFLRAVRMIHTIKGDTWKGPFTEQQQKEALAALEEGQVLFFPSLSFSLKSQELALLSPHFADPRSKNIGYDSKQKKVGGAKGTQKEVIALGDMLGRYATEAQALVESILPYYKKTFEKARTSYRPMEIAGRRSSYRKDDTLLHVDSFPSSPVQGKRILRVFTNINPHGQKREWRLGEPFQKVVERFIPQCRKPLWGSSWLLEKLHITKSHRTLYDHYMLQMHDTMKADDYYQKTAQQIDFSFPSASTWIVYTDLTSHAAMVGQYALEQTFYLPVEGMAVAELSPLRILESFLGRSLV